MLRQLFVLLTLLAVFAAKDIKVDIDEEVSPGTEVTRLTDHPESYTDFSPFLTYAILNQNTPPASYFRIDSKTGVVSVARKIDREDMCDPTEICQAKFNIAIYAGGNTTASFAPTVVTLVVVINDINDNPPMFPARDVTLDIPEGAKVGAELKLSGAIDRDSKPEFIVQHYNITPATDIFSITPSINLDGSSTITLRLENELDRETKDRYNFNIVAFDGGSNPQTDFLSVTVRVTDDNDNSPKFNQSQYELKINENEAIGAKVGQVTAWDKDIGDFGRITYSFSSSSEAAIKGVFAIDSSSGWITLQGDLRTIRRSSAPFLMFVDAKDAGDPPLTTQTRVSVLIVSSGRSPPFFKVNTITAGDVYTLSIPETAGLDYFLAFVDVEGFNGGDKKDVTCHMASGLDFKLSLVPDKGYTLLLNAALDREKKDSYQITITCREGGSFVSEAQISKTLTVNITDANDSSPKFLKNLYTSTVDENRDSGQFVTQVVAQDADIGANAEVTYSLEDAALDYIKINARTGVISTSSRLDREKNTTLRFKVYATDGGEIPNRGEAEVLIAVRDVNDNTPQFNVSKFLFAVSEHAANNTIVGTLAAYDLDADINSQFDFYFGASANGDLPLPFIVLKDGSIELMDTLDRETRSSYSFTVIVRDRGAIPRSSAVPVEIKVLDENDNDPVILFPTSQNHTIVISNVPENGMVLGRIIAYDVDEDDSTGLRYIIYDGNEDSAFSMGLTNGELVLQNVQRLQNPQDYYLYVKVEDSSSKPRNATTQVRIEVRFENLTDSGSFNQNESSRDQYVIIVGVIGGATIVLSIIIITAIFIILRSEKTRRTSGNPSSYKNKFFTGATAQVVPNEKRVETMDTGKSQSNSSLGSDPHGLILIPGNLGRKNDEGQKKVSFSLQDEFHDQGQVLLPEKQMCLNLPPILDSSTRWKALNNPDDISSDVSGESGTCDSGRGTSDEDIKFDHSPNRDPYRSGEQYLTARDISFDQFITHNSGNLHRVQNNQGQGRSRIHTPTPPPKPELVTFQDARVGRHDGSRAKSGYQVQRQLPPSTFVPPQTRQHNHNRMYSPYKERGMNLDHTRPNSAMSSPQHCLTTSMDDDASTTTSGSYVITPDDVKLDGFRGKDVVI